MRSVPRLYNEGQLPLEESREKAVRSVGWCEIAASLEVSWGNEWVVRQSPASKDVNTEYEEATALEDVPGDNRWRYSRLRRLSACCSELQSVWISDSAVVTCSYGL
jgi:hypothetical protein